MIIVAKFVSECHKVPLVRKKEMAFYKNYLHTIAQAGNLSSTYNKSCAQVLELILVSACSFSAPFQSRRRIIKTSRFSRTLIVLLSVSRFVRSCVTLVTSQDGLRYKISFQHYFFLAYLQFLFE